jgi:hypothetical protein
MLVDYILCVFRVLVNEVKSYMRESAFAFYVSVSSHCHKNLYDTLVPHVLVTVGDRLKLK